MPGLKLDHANDDGKSKHACLVVRSALCLLMTVTVLGDLQTQWKLIPIPYAHGNLMCSQYAKYFAERDIFNM